MGIFSPYLKLGQTCVLCLCDSSRYVPSPQLSFFPPTVSLEWFWEKGIKIFIWFFFLLTKDIAIDLASQFWSVMGLVMGLALVSDMGSVKGSIMGSVMRLVDRGVIYKGYLQSYQGNCLMIIYVAWWLPSKIPEGVVKACYGLVELHQNCVHIAKGVVPHLKVVIIFSIKMNVLLILLDHGQPPPRAPATTILKYITYGQEPEHLRFAKSWEKTWKPLQRPRVQGTGGERSPN